MSRPVTWLVALCLTLPLSASASEPTPPPAPDLPGVSPELKYPFEVTPPITPSPAPEAAPTAEPVVTPEPPKEEEKPPGPPVVPEMLGDQAPINVLLTLRPGLAPKPGAAQILVPSPRYFKISDNDSPEPRHRTYVSFN